MVSRYAATIRITGNDCVIRCSNSAISRINLCAKCFGNFIQLRYVYRIVLLLTIFNVTDNSRSRSLRISRIQCGNGYVIACIDRFILYIDKLNGACLRQRINGYFASQHFAVGTNIRERC